MLQTAPAWAVEHDVELLVAWPSEDGVGFYRRYGFRGEREPLVWYAS